jgi:hypothetical protein
MNARSALPMEHAMAPPFAHAEAAPQPAAACFDAPVPGGPLRLRLEGARVRHAVDAALALHRCESLLRALETWSGIALDWRWVAAPALALAPAPTTRTHAQAHWCPAPDGDGAAPASLAASVASPAVSRGVLELPWAWLRELPAPGAELAQSLQWPALPAVLCVAEFRLEAGELAQVEPGGAIVLPPSLTPPWHGLLRAACEPALEGLGVPVSLPLPATPLLAARGARPRAASHAAAHEAADARIACEVRLSLRGALPADRLAGWFEGEALADAGPRASLWCRLGAHEPAHRAALGRLMPRGDGWALAIETLCDAMAGAVAH